MIIHVVSDSFEVLKLSEMSKSIWKRKYLTHLKLDYGSAQRYHAKLVFSNSVSHKASISNTKKNKFFVTIVLKMV